MNPIDLDVELSSNNFRKGDFYYSVREEYKNTSTLCPVQ